MESYVHIEICTWMLRATLFGIDWKRKQREGLWSGEWLNKVSSARKMELYSATKKEWVLETCYHTDEFPNNYAKWKHRRPKQGVWTLWFYLHKIVENAREFIAKDRRSIQPIVPTWPESSSPWSLLRMGVRGDPTLLQAWPSFLSLLVPFRQRSSRDEQWAPESPVSMCTWTSACMGAPEVRACVSSAVTALWPLLWAKVAAGSRWTGGMRPKPPTQAALAPVVEMGFLLPSHGPCLSSLFSLIFRNVSCRGSAPASSLPVQRALSIDKHSNRLLADRQTDRHPRGMHKESQRNLLHISKFYPLSEARSHLLLTPARSQQTHPSACESDRSIC